MFFRSLFKSTYNEYSKESVTQSRFTLVVCRGSGLIECTCGERATLPQTGTNLVL